MIKAQVEEFRCVWGRGGRTGDAKATGASKYQLGINVRSQMIFIAVYKTLLLEERQ